MELLPTAEQEQLAASVRALLAEPAVAAGLRATVDDGAGPDRALWRRLGHDVGVLGLTVPENLGGAGAGHVERSIVASELGRALAPVPFLGSAVLALDLVQALDGHSDLLAALASGDRTGAVAVAAGGDVLSPGSGVRSGAEGLDGRAWPVVDGDVADVLLVLASTSDGPAFFRVEGDAPGLTRTPLRTLDPTRSLARVDLAGTPGVRLAGDADAALARVTDTAAVALAAEQVGLMGRAVERTVEYATTRVQFGRAIGSYQAVKHGCADMYAATEQAVAAVRAAAWAADHDPAALPELAAVAAVYVGPACFSVARAMVQYHGGTGYTWDHDAHLFYKRAKADELLFGSSARQRARLADLVV